MKRKDKKQERINKKCLILEELLRQCQERREFVFHNDLVRDICRAYSFGNPFDITKLDSKDDLPLSFRDKNICLLHLGKGWHRFVNGADRLYHTFETIQDSIECLYKKRLLDDINHSESKILSIANHQRILHHFLFFYNITWNKTIDRENVPDFVVPSRCNNYVISLAKTYFPHRTKTSLEYCFNGENINARNQQIEIDLAIEDNGNVCIFEAKNGTPKDFNICQIYHPFLYYYSSGLAFKKIICVYCVYNKNSLKLWAYTFDEPKRLDSIRPLKYREYILKWY